MTADQIEAIARHAARALAPDDIGPFVTEATTTLSALGGLTDRIADRIVHGIRRKYFLPADKRKRLSTNHR
jgi:hypothetical protein